MEENLLAWTAFAVYCRGQRSRAGVDRDLDIWVFLNGEANKYLQGQLGNTNECNRLGIGK